MINIYILGFFTGLLFIFTIVGQNLTQLFSKKKEILLIEFYPIIGLGFFSIIVTTLYISINFSVSYIRLIFYFIFFFFIFLNIFFYKNFFYTLKIFIKIFIKIFPILFFFLFLTIIYGENFYVFRGNYYDIFTQLSQGLIFEQNNHNDLSKLLLKQGFIAEKFTGFNDQIITNEFSKIHYNYSLQNIFLRPFNALILAFFFNFKILSLFEINYVLKILFLSLNFLSVNLLVHTIFNQQNFFYKLLPYVYIFSTWSLYSVDIDALGHLTSQSFFWSIIALTTLIYKKYEFEFLNIIYFIILLSALLIIYPTFLFIILALLVFLLLNAKDFFLKNIKSLSYIIVGYLIINSLIFTYFINISLGETGRPDYWTYFGSFILGRESVVLDQSVTAYIKTIISKDISYFEKLYEIIKVNFSEGYIFIPINIFLSFFGLYFLTPSSFYDYLSYLLLPISIFLLYLIILNFKNGLKIIFHKEKEKYFILGRVTIFYVLLSIVLFLTGRYYGLIKVYFFFSPIIFFLGYAFIKNSNKLNNFLLLPLFFCLIFPIYKYSDYNHGINRLDSFPSIISKYQKQDIIWKIDKNQLTCNEYLIDNSDFYNEAHYNNRILADGYVSLYLDFLQKNEISINVNIDRVCKIRFQKGKFKVINN